MSEKKLVVDQLKLTYSGLFDFYGLYHMIDGFFYEEGYDRMEKKNYEQVLPSGKDIELDMRPWKKQTDYAKSIIQIRIIVTELKDVEIEKEGVKHKINQGNILIIINSFLDTDYENRWESSPLFYFLRTIMDKYIFRHYTDLTEKKLIEDTKHIHDLIKSYLNLYKA